MWIDLLLRNDSLKCLIIIVGHLHQTGANSDQLNLITATLLFSIFSSSQVNFLIVHVMSHFLEGHLEVSQVYIEGYCGLHCEGLL